MPHFGTFPYCSQFISIMVIAIGLKLIKRKLDIYSTTFAQYYLIDRNSFHLNEKCIYKKHNAKEMSVLGRRFVRLRAFFREGFISLKGQLASQCSSILISLTSFSSLGSPFQNVLKSSDVPLFSLHQSIAHRFLNGWISQIQH